MNLTPASCSECRFMVEGPAFDMASPLMGTARWCLLHLDIEEMDGKCAVGIRRDDT